MTVNSELLQFLPALPITQKCPILFVKDCPQANEVDMETPFGSQMAKMEFNILASRGIRRDKLHASYVFSFRPPSGECGALFWEKEIPLDGYVSWGEEKNVFLLDFAYHELKRLRDEIVQTGARFIIAQGKWALYFLTGLPTFPETQKSSYGSLMKWRGSHLTLAPWWGVEGVLVIPSLPLNCKFDLPSEQFTVDTDLRRIAKVADTLLNSPDEFPKMLMREEHFYLPPDLLNDEIQENFDLRKQEFFQIVKEVLYNLISLADNSEELFLSIDVETKGYSYIDCLGIAWSKSHAICIPFESTRGPSYWTEEQEGEILPLLFELFLHPNVRHVGQNYMYDMAYMQENMLLQVMASIDTMVYNHCIFSVMEKNLGYLSSIHCDVHVQWKGTGNIEKGATNSDRWLYNCRDTCTTFEIAMKVKDIEYAGWPKLREVIRTQMEETYPSIYQVMRNGMLINEPLRDSYISDLLHKAELLDREFKAAVQEDINLNSPIQLKALFYDLFLCPKQWKEVTDTNGNKKMALSLDEDALLVIRETELLIRPFIDILLDYKKLTKTAAGLKALTVDDDGLLRTSYGIAGTDTYRFNSTSNPFGRGTNIQVMSKGRTLSTGEKLPNSKKLFIPPPGMTEFDIDLDSADLRIVMANSNAVKLQEMFDAGLKPYVEAMKEYYRDPTKNKNSEEYKLFKACIHALDYMGSASGIAGRVGLLTSEVDRIAKWWFSMNPEIKAWHRELENQVRKRQYIENIFGYRRYFFDLRQPTLMQVAAAWGPQSTVALLINKGMNNIRLQEPEIIVKRQTHDALAGHFPTERADPFKTRVIELCTVPLPYSRPLVIPVDIVTSEVSWGDCH